MPLNLQLDSHGREPANT